MLARTAPLRECFLHALSGIDDLTPHGWIKSKNS